MEKDQRSRIKRSKLFRVKISTSNFFLSRVGVVRLDSNTFNDFNCKQLVQLGLGRLVLLVVSRIKSTTSQLVLV